MKTQQCGYIFKTAHSNLCKTKVACMWIKIYRSKNLTTYFHYYIPIQGHISTELNHWLKGYRKESRMWLKEIKGFLRAKFCRDAIHWEAWLTQPSSLYVKLYVKYICLCISCLCSNYELGGSDFKLYLYFPIDSGWLIFPMILVCFEWDPYSLELSLWKDFEMWL